MSDHYQSWRLNLRAALVLTGLSIVAIGGLWWLDAVQGRRVLRSALDQAQAFETAGEASLALRHVGRYLEFRPDDSVALDLQGRILAATARDSSQLLAAAGVHEKLLRIDPDGAASQEVRRRLVSLYLRQSDALRESTSFRIAPELAMSNLRYQAAERVARELIRRGGSAAKDHRLLAMALEGRAVPGAEGTLDEAITEYESALVSDPGDKLAAGRLAMLLKDRKKDPGRAERVLDTLLKARPDDPEVRIIRHHFLAGVHRDDHSAAELQEAARLAPRDVQVRVSAAHAALRRGDRLTARRLIDELPESTTTDLRVLMIRGQVELSDEHLDKAIDEWRQGLKRSGGNDPELTWRLAYTLLERGRMEEAVPLVRQFRRLVGDDAPPLQILEALREERTGRVTRAIVRLDRVLDRLDERWKRTALLALGRCYENLSDDTKALEVYRRRSSSSPRSRRLAWRSPACLRCAGPTRPSRSLSADCLPSMATLTCWWRWQAPDSGNSSSAHPTSGAGRTSIRRSAAPPKRRPAPRRSR